jgi:hypothetical protein
MDKININKIKDNILNLPGYKLKDINKIVDTYLLKDFNFNKNSLPCIILLLPDKETKKGHYVALNINKNKDELYYFDSYGNDPIKLFEDYPDMINDEQNITKWSEFLKNFNKIHYNEKKLQLDESRLCGYYCLDYILLSIMIEKDFKPEDFTNLILKIYNQSNIKDLPFDYIIIIIYYNILNNL